MDIYVLMRKEAEVFAQAPVLHLNCSQAKSRVLRLCWDLVRPLEREQVLFGQGRCPGCGEQAEGSCQGGAGW